MTRAFFRRRLLLTGSALMVAQHRAFAQVASPAAAAHSPTSVILGTATPGGGFPAYGAAFAETVQEVDPSLRIEPRNTKGSAENIPLIEAGQLDIALVAGEPLYEALNGIGRSSGSPASLRLITAMYSSPGMFVLRRDNPARTIADLLGKPVAFGAKGSGLVILARYVLDGLGHDMNRDFQPVFLDRAGDGPAMVDDGRVAALWGGGSGWPGFTAVANSKAGARFVVPDDAQIQRIVAKHSLLKPMTIPAGSYPQQSTPIHSLGSWSFVIARTDLPDDTAYRLARAIHRGETALGRRLPPAAGTTLTNTVSAAPRADLVHPGVRQYLNEAGYKL